MMKALAKLTISATCASLSTYYFYRNDLSLFADSSYKIDIENDIGQICMFTRKPWDSNWDKRDPMSIVDMDLYLHADKDGKQKLLEEATPTATRNIFLIRHAQCDRLAKEIRLTELGIEQSKLLGKRLADMNIRFDQCAYSPVIRAEETAKLILGYIHTEKSYPDSLLEEGTPPPPEPPGHLSFSIPNHEYFIESARMEAAFRKYFHRANPKQKEDSYEIIVSHGNLSRYLIVRALQLPTESWLRTIIGNTGLTWIVIKPNGHVFMKTMGDIGHLPPNKLSFN